MNYRPFKERFFEIFTFPVLTSNIIHSKSRKPVPPKKVSRCPVCKFRIRGENHEKGDHHLKGRGK